MAFTETTTVGCRSRVALGKWLASWKVRGFVLGLMAFVAFTPILADEETDSLRQNLAAAQQAHSIADETIARERLAVSFYNRLMFDSLIVSAPDHLAYYEKVQDWEHYYYIWRIVVSAYLYSDRSNTALRECRKMYEDAQRRQNDYGIAMASHVMGLAYSNMQYYEEAQKAMERSLNMMTVKGEPFMQVGIYGDYCEVLAARKDWQRLLPATENWHKALYGWGHERGMTDGAIDSTIYATYCFVAQAKAQRGLGNFDEAERLLNLATRNAKQYGEGTDEGFWHHVVGEWASYYQDRKDFAKALSYNDEIMYWARQRGVDTEITGVEQQRAEILMALGRYKEASELWQKIQIDTKEQNLKDAKNQLSEMNTLFQLDEMEVERQTARTRYTIIMASIIVVALLLLSVFRLLAARRLAQKNRELAVALDHARESDRMKTSFIQHVSHEIRTPLNIITGFTQVLNTPDYVIEEKERNEMLGKINDNTQQITQIVNELLDLSSTESRSMIERSDETSVASLCQQAILESDIHPTETVDFRLENEVADSVVVQTNVQSVVKVLKNLLQNAAKFTQQGSITLKATLADNRLQFHVTDTGIGIPAEAQQRIFEKFEKVDAFREGIGLGLSVARALARRMGGDVLLAHSDSGGSTFVLTLPLSE